MNKNESQDNRVEYLKNNVNPILEPMLLDILSQRPTNILDYMIDYLTKKRNETHKSNEEDKKSPIIEHASKTKKQVQVTSDDDDDDVIDDLPIVKRKTGITRKAISAEAYGAYNKKEDFVARVIPKTEDQKNRHFY